MSAKDKKRQYLDEWSKINSNQKVNQISIAYPDCSCENVAKTHNGHGPVSDGETLRVIILSTMHINLKNKPNKEIGPSIFSRIFSKGLSAIRVDKADILEQISTIEELYDITSKISEIYGGIMGIVDFSAESVRKLEEFDYQVCCILDTPIANKISHADIVSSRVEHDNCVKIKIKNELFKNIGGAKAFVAVSDITDYVSMRYEANS